MGKNTKRLSTVAALTLAVSPAYGAENQKSSPTTSDTTVHAYRSEQPVSSEIPSEPIRVNDEDIELTDHDSVTIRNSSLTYHLMLHPKVALALLSEMGPLELADVAIGEDGRVIIRNAEFAANLGKYPHETNARNLNCKNEGCRNYGC